MYLFLSFSCSNENFCGNDIINLYAMNKNGVQDARVPIFVEPINDPPIIHAPKSIVLGKMESSDGYQIYDRQRDVFDFLVVEPDIFGFPGKTMRNRTEIYHLFGPYFELIRSS